MMDAFLIAFDFLNRLTILSDGQAIRVQRRMRLKGHPVGLNCEICSENPELRVLMSWFYEGIKSKGRVSCKAIAPVGQLE